MERGEIVFDAAEFLGVLRNKPAEYEANSKDSNVPYEFHFLSDYLINPEVRHISTAQASDILFDGRFNDSLGLAYLAIKYANAMSRLRLLEYARSLSDNQETLRPYENCARLAVLDAISNEGRNEDVEKARKTVELHFSDPVNVARLRHLYESIYTVTHKPRDLIIQ